MTMTAAQQREIIEKESAWVDESFGQLDLSAFPALNELPPEQSRDDDRFARAYGDTALSRNASDLRRFLSDPDTEALEQIGSETGNPSFLRDVRDRRAEAVVLAFKKSRPDYLPTNANFSAMVKTLAYNTSLSTAEQKGDVSDVADRLIERGYWTLENLQAVFDTLDRAGVLDYPANHARPLRESQRLRAEQLAANGDVLGGIVEYVKGRISEEAGYQVAFTLADPVAFTTDPQMRPILEEACWFCWQAYRKDYSPTSARQQFMRDYCAGRFFTVALLDAAWEECQRVERDATRSALFSPDTPEHSSRSGTLSPSLDQLDDAAIDDLYHRSLREYAREAHRQSGILV